jgi:hypothetical protein
LWFFSLVFSPPLVHKDFTLSLHRFTVKRIKWTAKIKNTKSLLEVQGRVITPALTVIVPPISPYLSHTIRYAKRI